MATRKLQQRVEPTLTREPQAAPVARPAPQAGMAAARAEVEAVIHGTAEAPVRPDR